jgi:hypothetical protein
LRLRLRGGLVQHRRLHSVWTFPLQTMLMRRAVRV